MEDILQQAVVDIIRMMMELKIILALGKEDYKIYFQERLEANASNL